MGPDLGPDPPLVSFSLEPRAIREKASMYLVHPNGPARGTLARPEPCRLHMAGGVEPWI